MYRILKIEKLANKFFKLSNANKLFKTAALDNKSHELLNRLNKIIKSLESTRIDDSFIEDVRTIQSQYTKAVELSDGFQVVEVQLETLYDDYGDILEPDDDSETAINSILNLITNDIINRAEGNSSEGLNAKLDNNIRRQIIDAGETFFSAPPQFGGGFVGSDPSAGGGESATEKSEDIENQVEMTDLEDTPEPGEDYASVDFEGGNNTPGTIYEGGPIEPGKMTGVQTEKVHQYTKWIEKYKAENEIIKRKAERLNNIDATKTANEVSQLYNKLGYEADRWVKLYNEKRETEPTPERNAIQEKMDSLRDVMRPIREAIRVTKAKFTAFFRANHIKDLKNNLSKIRDPKERFIKEQEIAIAETTASKDFKISQSQKLRREIVRKLQGQTIKDQKTGQESIINALALTPQLIKEFNEKLEPANKLRVSKHEHDKMEGEKTRKQRKVIRQTPKGVANIIDVSAQKIDGHITSIRLAFSSERSTVKDNVIKFITEKISNEYAEIFNTLIKNIAAAAKKVNVSITKKQNNPNNPKIIEKHKKNEDELRKAIAALRKNIKETMKTQTKNSLQLVQPKITQLMISIRSSKFLYNYRNQLQVIAPLEDAEVLSPEDANKIQSIIDLGKNLANYYANMKIPQLGRPGERPKRWHESEIGEPELKVEEYLPGKDEDPYKTPTEAINNSVVYLEKMLANKPIKTPEPTVEPITGPNPKRRIIT